MKTKILVLLTFVTALSYAQVKKPAVKQTAKTADPFKIEREGSGGMSGSFPGFCEVSSKKL